jgi:hypothetical protein
MTDMTDTDSVAEGAALGEERLEILRLVENQTITAEEAARLLEALDRSDRERRSQSQDTVPFMAGIPAPPPFPGPGPRPRPRGRNVRIRITDVEEEEVRLNLVLPHPLLEAGLKMAKRFAPDHLLDAKDIRESIDEGFEGPILDILDDDQRVEIVVEVPDVDSGLTRELREVSRMMKGFGQ